MSLLPKDIWGLVASYLPLELVTIKNGQTLVERFLSEVELLNRMINKIMDHLNVRVGDKIRIRYSWSDCPGSIVTESFTLKEELFNSLPITSKFTIIQLHTNFHYDRYSSMRCNLYNNLVIDNQSNRSDRSDESNECNGSNESNGSAGPDLTFEFMNCESRLINEWYIITTRGLSKQIPIKVHREKLLDSSKMVWYDKPMTKQQIEEIIRDLSLHVQLEQ